MHVRRSSVALLATGALMVGTALTAGAAHAEDPSPISGIVTDSSGVPLAGIDVAFYIPNSSVEGGWEATDDDTTDADGKWIFPGYGTGSYRLAFADVDGVYAKEFYSNKRSIEGANTVVVPECGKQVNVSLAKGGLIHGRVLDRGSQPMQDINISVWRLNGDAGGTAFWDRENDFYSTLSKADGTYTVGGLQPGTYRVCYDEGYNDGANIHAPLCYRTATKVGSAANVTVTALTQTNLQDVTLSFSTPSLLKAASTESTRLNLTWKLLAGAPKYRIQYATKSSMSGAKYVAFSTNSGTLTGLTPKTKYYFRAVVVDANNNVKLSEYTGAPYPSATTTAQPPAPGNLHKTGQTTSTLDLAWNAVGGAARYRIQYSKSSTMSGANYRSFTTNSATLTGLSPHTKYYFRVVVVDADDIVKLSEYTPAPYPSGSTS